ncbi:MAG TPA: hypothetical protein VMR86_19890 [Myxococcota bacterium]|nr:hypothetical protein [Myxococcota bacterium]
MSAERRAVGLRVKTGRATAVVVAGSAQQPRVIERRALQLYDPAVPHSGQPYHVELELPPEAAAPLLARALEAIRAVAGRELEGLRESLVGDGGRLCGLALVAGSLGDPSGIRNPHVRAHALEGQVYWKALQAAAQSLGLACAVIAEKELWEHAARALGRRPDALRATLADWGRALGKPWAAEEKCAALAAWSALR